MRFTPRQALLVLLCGMLLPWPFFRAASARNVAIRQEEPRVSQDAAQQIQTLMRMKATYTADQRKVDSKLLFALRKRRGDALPGNLQALRVDVQTDAQGAVLVDIKADVTEQLIQNIIRVGGEIIRDPGRYPATGFRRAGTIRARVPLLNLEELARSRDVKFIRRAVEAHTYKGGKAGTGPGVTGSTARRPATPPAALTSISDRAGSLRARLAGVLPGAPFEGASGTQDPIMNAGTASSQGDVAHRAGEARRLYGVNGSGVKIGVLSDSVRYLAQSQASGDLPSDVTVLPGQSGTEPDVSCAPCSGEGTAMLEIIHDLAPGAKLFFATAARSRTNFADNIRRLRFEAGCDIIVDDVIYFNESPFQDDEVARAVNDVTADGGLYFSAAGNLGNFNDGTSGTWEGDYAASANTPPVLAADLIDVLDFGSGNISNRLEGSGTVFLHWSDPLGASANDYDLFVLDANLTQVLDFSTDEQNGDDDPFEGPFLAFSGERIIVTRFASAEIRALSLRTFGDFGVGTPGATWGHSSATGAFSVAAVNWAVAGGLPFTGGPTNPVETFSSDGPRRIFYRPDGTPIGGVTFASGGGETRQDPDITAADGVSTAVPGFSTFSGTSAAAPHAAAIAGLLKSAAPALTAAQVRAALTSTALDIEALGVDRDSGAGILNALRAVESIGATREPFLELGAVRAIPTGGDGDPFIEPGESGALSIQLVNTSGAIATNVSATLTTATPAVVVTQGSSAYPDIPPSGSAANITRFTFALPADAPCGLLIDFKLTVTYAGRNSPQVFGVSVRTGTEVIVNGGFESGSLTGWTQAAVTGSGGTFLVSGVTTLPLSGLPTVGPKSGMFYAVSDMTGPGTHALLQSFQVPASSPRVILSFDMFANNFAGTTVVNPVGLDHRFGNNQHARVDLLRADATPFDTGAGVLRNFFLGADEGPNPHAYTHYQFDITDLAGSGGTFQLRFAVSDNLFYFNLGVDNVSVSPSPCEISGPGTGAKVNAGLFRSGFWVLDVDGNQEFNAPPDRTVAFGGLPGDIPITGDWNGDGRTKVGVYRSVSGLFLLDFDGDGQFTAADKIYDLGLGAEVDDLPVVGDWSGEGRDKVGLFRRGFFWILDYNGNGSFEPGTDRAFAFGGPGDVPVVGDWNGDGRSKVGLFRQGYFWILDSDGSGSLSSVNQPGGDEAFAFGGVAGDVPVVGDWSGDGRSKVGVFRQGYFWVLDANGNHRFDGTGPGQDLAFPFGGIASNKPVVGKW